MTTVRSWLIWSAKLPGIATGSPWRRALVGLCMLIFFSTTRERNYDWTVILSFHSWINQRNQTETNAEKTTVFIAISRKERRTSSRSFSFRKGIQLFTNTSEIVQDKTERFFGKFDLHGFATVVGRFCWIVDLKSDVTTFSNQHFCSAYIQWEDTRWLLNTLTIRRWNQLHVDVPLKIFQLRKHLESKQRNTHRGRVSSRYAFIRPIESIRTTDVSKIALRKWDVLSPVIGFRASQSVFFLIEWELLDHSVDAPIRLRIVPVEWIGGKRRGSFRIHSLKWPRHIFTAAVII